MDAVRCRRALTLFGVIVTALAAGLYVPIVQAGSFNAVGGLAMPLIMWAPAVAALVSSIVVFRSVRPIGFGGNRRTFLWLLVAFAVPLAYTLIIYPSLAALGLVSLGSQNLSPGFFAIGLMQSLLFATGEEIGWRGFASPLMTRKFGFVPGQLLLGVVWFLYHLPALLFTSYGKSSHLLAGNLFFLISVLSLSVFLGFVRQVSDSLWPCAIFHAAHNLVFLNLFDPMQQTSTIASWLVGEQGILLAIVLTAAGIYGARAHKRLGEPSLPGSIVLVVPR